MNLKPEFENIIWDWNGTLLDDAWLGVEIMDKLLKKRNLQGLILEEYREIFDFPVKEYYARLGFDFSKEPFESIGNEFIERYNERHFECKLKPYALESLLKFKKSGFKQYVLSARNHNQLKNEFEFHKIEFFFENFAGLPDNLANGKADLGIELIRLELIAPEKTLMIGDTLHDYEVAKNMGISCILVTGGHQSINRLKSSNAQIIKDLRDLWALDTNQKE